jgi:hypothetical protein
MIRRQFLPSEPTNHPHSPIWEPANERARAKPSPALHAVGNQQAAHSHQQCMLSLSDAVVLVRIPCEVFVRTTCVEHSAGTHHPKECGCSRYRHGCDPPALDHSQLSFLPSVFRQLTSSSFRLRRIHVRSRACVRILTLAYRVLGLLACGRGGGDAPIPSTSMGVHDGAGTGSQRMACRYPRFRATITEQHCLGVT